MAFGVIRVSVAAVCMSAAGFAAVHTLQAKRYQIAELHRQTHSHSEKLHKPDFLIGLLTALLDWYLPMLLSLAIPKEAKREAISNYLMLGAFALAAAVLFFLKRREPMDKPFAWTQRVCRLMALNLLIDLAACAFLELLGISPYLLLGAAELSVAFSAMIMEPIEERFNTRFYASAAEKLAEYPNLIRIGVTGSYGKTSVKLILKTILSEKYRVLCTPQSFSTAMGISRVIDEQLSDKHQVFIAEMGASQTGEIAAMAKLVKPAYAVLTNAGLAHIDSFGSVEAAAQAKNELIEALPEDGCAFFGYDGGYGDRLYAKCRREKYRSAGDERAKSDIHVEDLENGINGASFSLVTSDGKRQKVQTKLLGSYNAGNIALATSVALKLGMTLEEIARATARIKPMNHRLQLINGDVRIIDDSDGDCIEAACEALRVLRDFPGRHILITTNLHFEDENDLRSQNYAYGTQIADCADLVILLDDALQNEGSVGVRSIQEGIAACKFPKSAVHIARSNEEIAGLLQKHSEKGDTLLYEGVSPIKAIAYDADTHPSSV